MEKSEPVKDASSPEVEEYTSDITIENTRKLTECVESLANTIKRLEDPATFQVALNHLKTVE